ncbi:hypothetical protein [Nakamurella deserti]|uniref:Rv3212 family protein n=1 Tax=Nakamurella deserti TaxID=2164074 RepID=UPI0013009EB8|nr:hypothetical protein [Nakamurella deserti]
MMPLSRRRRLDVAVAVALTVLVVLIAVAVYLKSDARATTLTTGPEAVAPAPMTDAPAALDEVWTLPTDPGFPGVASPYGTVATATGHTVTGHDAVTGDVRWTYDRSNLALCAMGSGDIRADTLTASGAVRGILTAYSKGDTCSEITLLNPITGERTDQRTGFTAEDSTLVFGGPYGGMVSDDLVELWRYDLVRTIQYGDQPEPTKPSTRHLGCRFDDLAITTQQFATIEHCPDSDAGPNARLVINYVDPGATADGKSKSWDNLNHDPRATVDLQTTDARVLSVTSEKVAVLVGGPEPAVVVYDAAGVEVSRTPVPVTADDIVASRDQSRVTPVTVTADARYAWVGSTLIAVDSDDLAVSWTMADVRGTPALIGDQLLVPEDEGLAVVSAQDGRTTTTIPVDRTGYAGRIDVRTVGNTVVESRGTTVVGLRDPAAPATDPPLVTSSARPPATLSFPSGTTATATTPADSRPTGTAGTDTAGSTAAAAGN